MLLLAEGTDFVFNTIIAVGFAAFRAGLGTLSTEVEAAYITAAGATMTHRSPAYRARGCTMVAIIIAALDADIPIVRTHLPAAVIAGHPVPILQPDIGAVGVVGPQDPQNHAEKVKQPAITQRGSDGGRTIAFAEMPAADMGVGHII
jgi:hypothetical protein